MVNSIEAQKNDYANARHLAKHQVMGLTAVFLLGMGASLIGSDVKGSAKLSYSIILGLHILIAVALVIGSVMTAQATRKLGKRIDLLAHIGIGVILATFIAGVLTMRTQSSWWSYIMAVGFMVSLLIYGYILVQANDRLV